MSQVSVLSGEFESLISKKETEQIVRWNLGEVPCKTCGENLLGLGNFKLIEICTNAPRYRQERCMCQNCGQFFLIHYDFFDFKGHVNNFVFSQESGCKWLDEYTRSQVHAIESHLKICPSCRNIQIAEHEEDADLEQFFSKHLLKEVYAG